MTAVKKKDTKKASKKKVTKKKGQVDDFLSVSGSTKKKSSAKKSTKPSEHFPTDHDGENLAALLDEYSAAAAIEKAAKRKAAERKAPLQEYLLNSFARAWAATGLRPVTKTWHGLKSSFDYIVTKAITFSHDKAEEIEKEVGVDILEHTSVTSLVIDMAALAGDENGMKALKKFLSSVDMDACVERKLKLNDNFFDNIGQLCEKDDRKIERMLEILAPRINWKNIRSAASEEDNFDATRDMVG
jgi:hypothetical protein